MIPAVPVESQPEEFFRHVGNVFVKRMYLEKSGYSCIGHAHKHSHISCLAHGSVLLKPSDRAFTAPAFIDIPAGEHHQFIALADETVLYCIHDTQGLEPDDLGEPYTEKPCHSE